MKFRHGVILGALVVAAGIIGTGIYFLHRAADATDRIRQMAVAESDCADKVPAAIDLVQKRDSMQGQRIHVTGSAYHFNRRLQQCLVEVSTFEHGDTPFYVKSLVNAAGRELVFWSIAADSRGLLRNCFSANTKEMDCAEADKQWKTLMYE